MAPGALSSDSADDEAAASSATDDDVGGTDDGASTEDGGTTDDEGPSSGAGGTRKAWLAVFNRLDESGDGVLDLDEIKEVLEDVGSDLEADEVEEAVGGMDDSGDDMIDEDEFKQWWLGHKELRTALFGKLQARMARDEQLKPLKDKMYVVFDHLDEDEGGFLDGQELSWALNKAFTKSGVLRVQAEIDTALKEMDEDGDDHITFEEFFAWCAEHEKLALALEKSVMEKGDEPEPEPEPEPVPELLAKVPLLAALSPSERAEIAGVLESEGVEPDAAIITLGEKGDAMYFLDEGEAAVEIEGNIVMRYSPGDYFGELALLNNEPRKATVRAGAKGARCLKLSRANFDKVAPKLSFSQRLEVYDKALAAKRSKSPAPALSPKGASPRGRAGSPVGVRKFPLDTRQNTTELLRAYRKELADIDPKLRTPEPEDEPLLERVQDQDLSAADKTVAPDARQSLRDKYAELLDKALGAAEGPEHAEVTAILASICRVVEWEGLGAPTDKSYAECRAKFRELDDDGSGELEEEEIRELAHVRDHHRLCGTFYYR